MNDFKMSSETTKLIEICKATHNAWYAARAACKAAEKTYGHGKEFDDAYNEAVTASNTYGWLSLKTFRTSVSAIEADLLTDPSMAGLLADVEAGVKKEVEVDHGICITDAEAKANAAYKMARDFVSALVKQ
jgi:hypothetical protein